MKKLFTLTALLFGMMSSAMADNISASLKVESNLQDATLHVSLTNESSYVAFQMDVTLPEGWTVTGATPIATDRLKDGENVTIGSISYPTDFVLDYNVLNNNTVRIIGYNLGNHKIIGKSGDEIFSISLKKSNSAATVVTEWSATFSDVEFVNEEQLEKIDMAISNAENTAVGEKAGILGDANGDGRVTLSDVIFTLKYVAAADKSSFTNFVFDNANVISSNPEAITIADVIAILKLSK